MNRSRKEESTRAFAIVVALLFVGARAAKHETGNRHAKRQPTTTGSSCADGSWWGSLPPAMAPLVGFGWMPSVSRECPSGGGGGSWKGSRGADWVRVGRGPRMDPEASKVIVRPGPWRIWRRSETARRRSPTEGVGGHALGVFLAPFPSSYLPYLPPLLVRPKPTGLSLVPIGPFGSEEGGRPFFLYTPAVHPLSSSAAPATTCTPSTPPTTSACTTTACPAPSSSSLPPPRGPSSLDALMNDLARFVIQYHSSSQGPPPLAQLDGLLARLPPIPKASHRLFNPYPSSSPPLSNCYGQGYSPWNTFPRHEFQ